jgi:hypothetical protein
MTSITKPWKANRMGTERLAFGRPDPLSYSAVFISQVWRLVVGGVFSYFCCPLSFTGVLTASANKGQTRMGISEFFLSALCRPQEDAGSKSDLYLDLRLESERLGE